MIRSKDELRKRSLEVDLTGAQGNAHCLIATAARLCREPGTETEAILEEMRSGDYEQLVEVFEREFGAFVTLVR